VISAIIHLMTERDAGIAQPSAQYLGLAESTSN